MDEMYLIPMQQQMCAARQELRECNAYSGRFGLTLCGKDARSLHIGNAEQEELLYLLQSRTREQRRQRQATGIELPAGVHTVSVRAADRPSPHADMGLDDLVLRVL